MIDIPPPPASRALEGNVLRVLDSLQPGTIAWNGISSSKYSAWLGIQITSIPNIGRQWVLDIYADPHASDTPLLMPLEPDTLIIGVYNAMDPSINARLTMDRPQGINEIDIPLPLFPQLPWMMDFSLAWSTD